MCARNVLRLSQDVEEAHKKIKVSAIRVPGLRSSHSVLTCVGELTLYA